MRAGQVAMTPRCEECERVWLPADAERWRAYRTDVDPDDEPAIGFGCPDCAEREFDYGRPNA